jgi:HSP20 family protein
MLLQELSRSRMLDALREMERLQSQFHKLLGWDREPSISEFPPVNVWTSQDGCIVTAEIPGVNPGDIELSVVNQTLTVKGSRMPDELKHGEEYHRRERGYGQFTRAIELPFPVDPDKVDARFSKGVLSVNLPRTEHDKPRKIDVKPA